MHELGILRHIAGIVERIADKNMIKAISSITLEIGAESGIVPRYLNKLFPLVAEAIPVLENAKLVVQMVAGNGLVIKEIRY